jgi:hypothetical protein
MKMKDSVVRVAAKPLERRQAADGRRGHFSVKVTWNVESSLLKFRIVRKLLRLKCL